MYIQTKNPNGQVDRIYGTIAKAATKDKFLDFRDALTLAYLEDFPQIQGIGGKDHAPVSGIRLLIQDNTKKQNVSAILPVHYFEKMLKVCEDNLYSPRPLDWQGKPPAEHAERYDASTAMANGYFTPHTEYSYSQTRVNTYKKYEYKGTTLVPVSILTINRKQFDENGVLRSMPWMVSISNFWSASKKQGNGMTSYIPSIVFGKKSKDGKNDYSVNERDFSKEQWQRVKGMLPLDLQFALTDDDMWRCCYAVKRFIELWEIAYGVPLIQAGVEAYEQQQQNYRNGGSGEQFQQQGSNQQQNGYDSSYQSDNYYDNQGYSQY